MGAWPLCASPRQTSRKREWFDSKAKGLRVFSGRNGFKQRARRSRIWAWIGVAGRIVYGLDPAVYHATLDWPENRSQPSLSSERSGWQEESFMYLIPPSTAPR